MVKIKLGAFCIMLISKVQCILYPVGFQSQSGTSITGGTVLWKAHQTCAVDSDYLSCYEMVKLDPESSGFACKNLVYFVFLQPGRKTWTDFNNLANSGTQRLPTEAEATHIVNLGNFNNNFKQNIYVPVEGQKWISIDSASKGQLYSNVDSVDLNTLNTDATTHTNYEFLITITKNGYGCYSYSGDILQTAGPHQTSVFPSRLSFDFRNTITQQPSTAGAENYGVGSQDDPYVEIVIYNPAGTGSDVALDYFETYYEDKKPGGSQKICRFKDENCSVEINEINNPQQIISTSAVNLQYKNTVQEGYILKVCIQCVVGASPHFITFNTWLDVKQYGDCANALVIDDQFVIPYPVRASTSDIIASSYTNILKLQFTFVQTDDCSVKQTTCSLKNQDACDIDLVDHPYIILGNEANNFALSTVNKQTDKGFYQTFCFSCTIQPLWDQDPITFTKDQMSILYCIDNSPIVRVQPSSPSRKLEVDVNQVGLPLIHNIDIIQFFDLQREDLDLCHMYVFEIQNLIGSIPLSPEVIVDNNQMAVVFSKQKFQYMTFYIKASAYENQVITDFSIRVDCISVNSINSSYVASKQQYPSVFPYSDPLAVQTSQNGAIVPISQVTKPEWIFKIVLPKTKIQEQEAYELNNIINWQVDHPSVLCKLQKVTLSGPNHFVSLAENPTLSIKMGDQANPIMSIATQEAFNYRVMITAEMMYANPPISLIDYALLIVCGQEKVINKKLQFDIQAYVNDPVMKLKLIDFFEVKSLESDVLPEECPIKEYFICIDEQCNSNSQDVRFKIKQPQLDENTQLFVSDNTFIDIDFYFPLDHQTFYLKAITTGDVSNIFPIKINVCGYEDINLKKDKFYSVLLLDGPEELVDFKELFQSNEPDCPVISYILDPQDTDQSMLIYQKAQSQLQIFPKIIGIFEFNVRAFTQSKVENKIKFTLTIQSQDEFDKQEFVIKQNNAPIFKVSPTLQHTVDLEINLSGKMVDSTDYTYTSEKAIDEEGHTFVLEVDGITDKINFVEVNLIDSKINLVVHRKMITKQSQNEINLSITLKDEQNKESPPFKFKITINYKEQKELEQVQVPKFVPSYIAEKFTEQSITDQVNEQVKQKSVNEQVNDIVLKPFRPASEMTDEELDNETFLEDEFVNDTMKEEGLYEDQDQVLLNLRKQAIKKGQNAENNRRLRLNGFQRYRLGYSFPKLDIKFIEEKLKQNILMKRKGLELPKTKPPKLLIKSILSNGTIPFEFDQKMLSPTQEIDQKIYAKIFKVQIKSLEDLSVYTGVFGQQPNNQTRLLQSEEEDDILSEAEKMKFYSQVKNHNENQFSIDLIFENPKVIEIGGKATIIIEFLDLKIFKSASNFNELNEDSFENGITKFEYQLPPIVADKDQSSNLQQNAEDAGDFLRSAQGGNFVVQLLLRGSSQVFYGTIRALQIISYSGLVDVNLPYNTFVFLQATIQFAQMDVLQSEDYYEEMFKFKETTALSQKYEFNGIGDKNFINNSGSYLTMLIILFFSTMFLFILNKCAACCFKYKVSRQVGIWAYAKCYYDALEQQCCKLILESYFDIAICSFINIMAFLKSKNKEDFFMFFVTIDDAMCSIIVIIHTFLIFLLPFFSHFLIYSTFGKEYDFEEEQSPWVPIIKEDLRENDYQAQLCTVYFIYRRLFTSIILVFLVHYPEFQLLFLMLLSTAYFMYLVIYHPYNSKVNNRTEIFNEFSVLMCCHCFSNLADPSITPESAAMAGGSFIFFAGINILVNVGFNIYISLIQSIQSIYTFYQDTKIKNLIQERYQRRQYLIDQLPGQFCQFNMELKCFKRYQFCKSFYPQLVWLKENLLDFRDLPDYQYYRFAVKGHNYKSAMESVAYRQCVQQVAFERSRLINKQKMQQNQLNVHSKITKTLANLKLMDTLNSKKFNTSTLKAIVEVPEDIISYEQELEQIKKDINDKIQVSGIKQLDYFFNYSFNRAYEQLYTYEIQYKMEKDLKFKTYIEIERSKYDDFGKPTYKLELENRLFTKLMNLNFMGFDKIQKHINDKVLLEISKSKEQKLKEVEEKDAIMNFKNTYKNGSLSTVIQCLLNIPHFKKFLIIETYKSQIGGEYSQDKKICEHLNQIFLSFYNDLRINKQNQVNLRPLSQLIKNIMSSEKSNNFNPEIFLITLIHGINLETMPKQLMSDMGEEDRSDQLVKDFYSKGEMNKLFRVLLETKQMCKLGHTQSKLCTSIGLKFKPKCKDRLFSKLIQDHFQPYQAKFKCKQCKHSHCHLGVEQNFILTLPRYLIIYFDTYQENLKLKYPALRIPNFFDIGDLFKKQGLRVPYDSCFKLLSTIAAPGDKKLEKVNFTAFIHQKVNKLEIETRFEKHQNVTKKQILNDNIQNQKNNIWLKFTQDKVQEMLGTDVRTRYSTYLAIYQRIDELEIDKQ